MKKQAWIDYEKAAEIGIKVILGILVLTVVLGTIFYFLGWFNEAALVAKKEFGAKAALSKYEWFVSQANGIEKMNKDISLFEARTKSVDEQYKGYGEDKAKWPLHISAQYSREKQLAIDDLIAVVSQRNNLVKEYNSASEKFNWRPFNSRKDRPKESFM
ncbi:hypothetical protein KKC67_00740 [Patescibacteria group bacterium]|nr:hypothetical protein [Patescibacteria group bacterium]MBU0879560.1 hypothetical protein [Patescibacteria group bacterium]MBU0880142.1 hypothetical protein [Patescibacteria group bacterium]MBU0898114.1 hypothetical protein [Patescibacteria group bacterium]MBU1062638.1 hypothetical protein [Patescibacteria group bacterium]